MKINDSKEISALQPTRSATESPAERRDQVSLEHTHGIMEQISSARAAAGASRAARLQAVEAAVRSGQFKPDPRQIAQRILDAAELDARLQALLPP